MDLVYPHFGNFIRNIFNSMPPKRIAQFFLSDFTDVEMLEQGDILQFNLQKTEFRLTSAVFNLFVNGEKWIMENLNSSSIFKTPTNTNTNRATTNENKETDELLLKHISITINKVMYNKSSHELSKIRTYSNYVGEIPKGYGQWIRFNITNMFDDWLTQMQYKRKYFAYDVFLKTLHPWIRHLIALDIKTSTVSEVISLLQSKTPKFKPAINEKRQHANENSALIP